MKMYKLLYLPDAAFVYDGDSTETNPKILTFKTKLDAVLFVEDSDFRLSDSNQDWCRGWVYNKKPYHSLKDPTVLKCLIEIVEVPDV